MQLRGPRGTLSRAGAPGAPIRPDQVPREETPPGQRPIAQFCSCGERSSADSLTSSDAQTGSSLAADKMSRSEQSRSAVARDYDPRVANGPTVVAVALGLLSYTIFGHDRPVAAPASASSSRSITCRAAAAATTAGPSTASHGRPPARCRTLCPSKTTRRLYGSANARLPPASAGW
jgi:hypothetical protein